MKFILFSALLGGGSIFIAIFAADFSNKGNHKMKLIFKSLASFLFVSSGIVASLKISSTYSVLILISLSLSFVGDFLLGLSPLIKNKSALAINAGGGLSFLLGHIVFVTAFINANTKFHYLIIPFALLIPAIFILLRKKYMSFNNKEFLPLLSYFIIIGIMSMFALNTFIDNLDAFGVSVIIGALLFSFSDLALMLMNFKNSSCPLQKTQLTFLVFIPYYLAQALFALSIAFS